jgi:hypothetical protein
MTTANESTIVPMGKNVLLVNRTVSNGPGVYSRNYISEADTLHITCKAATVSGKYFLKIYQIHGDAAGNETLLLTTGSSSSTTVEDLGYFRITGTFRVEIHYTNSLTLQIAATGLRDEGSAVVAQELASKDAKTAIWRNEQLCLLADIREHLEKMNNHLRYITGVSKDSGDNY